MLPDLDLSKAAAALDRCFGNKQNEMPKVAFMLVATPVTKDDVGETFVIANINDSAALLKIAQELINAMRLKGAEAAGSA